MKLGRYKHFKGQVYEVIGIGQHTETLESLVFYRREDDNPDIIFGYVRPYLSFVSDVLVNGKHVRRFEYIGEDKT